MQADTLYNKFQQTHNRVHIKLLQVQALGNRIPAIPSGTFQLHVLQSMIRRPVTLYRYSGNSSLHRSIHKELYKQPPHTSHLNKSQATSRYNWLAYFLTVT